DDEPGAPAPLCGAGTAPTPLARASSVPEDETVDIELGELSPGRYQLVARFRGPGLDGEYRRSAEFAVTCFETSCGAPTLSGLAADIRVLAGTVELHVAVIEAACMWSQYVGLVYQASDVIRKGATGNVAFML